MAIITNTPPTKGTTATAAELNSLFNDIKTATTANLNSQNLAGQSIDTQQFSLSGSSGQAGVVLIDYQSTTIGDAAGVTVPLQAGLTPTWSTVTGQLSYGASGLAMTANQVLRVYFNLLIDNKNYQTPFAATGGTYKNNFYCWAVWLEYAASWNAGTSSPDTWTVVPGQGEWTTTGTVGSTTYKTNNLDQIKATAIVPHAQYFNNGGTNTRAGQYTDTMTGQYYYAPTGNLTWYGFRLRIGGLFQTLGSGSTNYLAWEQSNGFDTFNSIVYGTGNITAILQRGQ